jgi:flagellar biosynthesis protein FlhG
MGTENLARRYAVVSGKGGVGKTVLTANLAASFASAGKRTLVVDADLGLANIDVILGLSPSYSLQDLLNGDRSIEEVLIQAPGGFELLPAGSGLQEGTILTPFLAEKLKTLVESLETQYDAIFFDAGAGIGEVPLFFASIADNVILVVTPEATSLMDAYATIKVLAQRYGRMEISLAVNQANPENPIKTGTTVKNHLQQIASRFLQGENPVPLRIQLVGSIPSDQVIVHAVNQQRLLAETSPQSPATHSITSMAESLSLLPSKIRVLQA